MKNLSIARFVSSSSSSSRAKLAVMAASLAVGFTAGCWRGGDPGTCNDRNIDQDEECDDGRDNQDPDTASPGQCTWECKLKPGCGDKAEDIGEECDDGRTGSEWCTNMCKRKPGCGNGIPDEGEECDHGQDNQTIENAAQGDCTAVSCKEARCGNHQKELGEACDEGISNQEFSMATAGKCTSTCEYAVCGDRETNKDEVCDDANLDDLDGCPNDCSCNDRCGNSETEVACGEECDRGPDGDHTCTDLCLMPRVCGDQVVDEGEECDDGNTNDSDKCVEGCKNAKCGDGFVLTETEACDDAANNGSYDSCSVDCKAQGPHCGNGTIDGPEECDEQSDTDCLNCWLRRMVFVTKTPTTGGLGGLEGADAICNAEWNDEANDNDKKFMAWLSSGEMAARTRLNSESFSGRYVLKNGSLVAKGWEGLTTTNLMTPINMHANGDILPKESNKPWVWTNTRDGEIFSPTATCVNWTATPTGSGSAKVGSAHDTSWGWSDLALDLCSKMNHLYCVEVQP